jgi:alpha-ketoglutarate-dependent taurine dioxygenase
MKTIEPTRPSFSTFRKCAPRALSLSTQELVQTGFLEPRSSIPLVMEPAIDDLDLVGWSAGQRDSLESLLLRHGAILFRGFRLASVEEFERFALAICPQLFGEYGDLPSVGEGKRVYKSTPYPADRTILFHNESSHQHRWPMKQWFFCVKAATERGETPIVDCRQIYARLEPAMRDTFERQGLLYVRNFVDGLDVSWSEFFKTDDRSRVEEYCRRSATEFEWLSDGGLRTRQRCPAVIRHPRTGEKSFFNQLQLHHVSFLEQEERSSLLSLFGAEGLPRNVYLGDGTVIEDDVAQAIGSLYWDVAVQFPWQEGDVLMLDNMLTAHARNPYGGERRIVVAMGEMVDSKEVV